MVPEFTIAGISSARDLGCRAAFASLGVPLEVVDVQSAAVREVYEADVLLVRPDLHVVWRGNAEPDEAERLAAIAAGY